MRATLVWVSGSRAGLRPLLAGAVAFIVALAPGAASAADCGTQLYSTCIDSDNVLPHAGSSRFMTLGGAETIRPGEVSFGLSTTYLSRPISIATDAGGTSTTFNVIDNQIDGSFLFAYGVTRRLELDAIVPVTFSQTGEGLSPVTGGPGTLPETGVRDLRFGTTFAIIPRKRVDPTAWERADVPRPNLFALAGRFEMSLPTGDTENFASSGYAVWSPGVSADFRYRRFFAGSEVGLRIRPTEEVDGARIGSQAFVSLGAGYDLLPSDLLSVAAEAYVLPTFAEQHSLSLPPGDVGTVSTPNGNYIAPSEWMVSVRSAPLFGGDVQIQAGGGGSIPWKLPEAPITNPRWRFSLSVRFAPLGRDTDGDGVPDKDDKCPLVKGVPGNPAGDGCPPSAEAERADLTGEAPTEAPTGPSVTVVPATPAPATPPPTPGSGDASGPPPPPPPPSPPPFPPAIP